ncbi:DUF2484 family protein [Tritonibacter mobilis]|uniref:DUF2484 family protein n=1 Tax=Tritonibacter mobilis TaxID=379347 RepID=UPI001C09D8B8|nr:DUF2484 family protein [Tritonibacter mobilis]MBU3034451.1 DUF2484 family protein [Tritonibacter mobilis]WHQ81530.1 DUF2484 family protein [Tritonibacter mobilis]
MMSLSLIASAVWVICASVVAFLPLRYQRPPGLLLLLIAPVLIWLLYRDFGLPAAAIGLFALLSMYRNPLTYLLHRSFGGIESGGPRP